MTILSVKRVAVIGAGPAGAITIDALAQEKAFDVIRVFERREGPGGCWSVYLLLLLYHRSCLTLSRIGDNERPPTLSSFSSLADRSADAPVPIPDALPTYTLKSSQPRFTESSIYPYLETNIDHIPMQFSQEPFPTDTSARSVELYGPKTPFRHWEVVKRYIKGLVERNGYEDLISYNTTVERAEKVDSEWKVTLRKEGRERDYWWTETFDAVVVASGHYSVPYIPAIEGLEDFEKSRPGSVIHSKHFRGRDLYEGKVCDRTRVHRRAKLTTWIEGGSGGCVSICC
jgi:cation diffusion facilitator CzcD-associated flavoprotein CzcO